MTARRRLQCATFLIAVVTSALARAQDVPDAGPTPPAASAPSVPPPGDASAPPPATAAPADTSAPAAAVAAPAETQMAVPEGPRPPPPRPTRERSPAMAATGGLMIGFGFLGLFAGAGFVALGIVEQEIGTCQDGVYGYRYHCGIGQTGEDFVTGGLVTMAISGGLIALGFPPLILGSQHVPRDEAAPRPALRVGAGSAKLEVAF